MQLSLFWIIPGLLLLVAYVHHVRTEGRRGRRWGAIDKVNQ
jgi:hypothetical protein